MTPSFYLDRICLNVLANDIHNMQEIVEATEGHVVIGVLSSSYNTVAEAVKEIQVFNDVTNNRISLGLGAGDPNQWKMVADISREVEVAHINQVFPAVGYTRSCAIGDEAHINGLIRPTDEIGVVNIATGPQSSKGKEISVTVEDAITLIKEMGGNAVKFFPMGGLRTKKQYQAVAEACAEADFILEPTGGIDLDNFEEIIHTALEAGVKQIIPHVYSSIISKSTGKTVVKDVERLYSIIKKAGDRYG